MPANKTSAPVRRGKLSFACETCQAKIYCGEAKAAGWRGRRVSKDVIRPPGSGNGLQWYCPEHIPDDMPEAAPLREAAVGPLGPRRRLRVYAGDHINNSSWYVFGFDTSDIAAAAGCREISIRRWIKAGRFNPRDLADVVRLVRERRTPARGRVDYDCFARVHRPGPSRESVIEGLSSVGVAAEADVDQHLVVVLGDRVTVTAADRLLEHMRAERVQTISRARARAVMLGLHREEAKGQERAEALADQLRQELGAGRAHGPEAVAVGGLVFDLERSAQLIEELKAAPPKRRAQLAGALALLGGLKPPKPRAATLARQRRKLSRVLVRSDVTAAG